MMNSPIIDLIIRLKNGYLARREMIESPYSIYREQVLKKLVALGYIKGFKVAGDKVKKIRIELLYPEGVPVFTDVKIYSTPGRKWYVAAKDIKQVLGGLGVSLVSTPQGILTGKEAKAKKVGGELLFDIW